MMVTTEKMHQLVYAALFFIFALLFTSNFANDYNIIFPNKVLASLSNLRGTVSLEIGTLVRQRSEKMKHWITINCQTL